MSPRTTQKKRDKDEARSKSWIREERLLAYEWKWAWPLMIMMAKKGRKSRLPWWDSRGGIRRQMRALPPPGGRCQWWYWPESWLELRSKLFDSDWPWFSPSFSLSRSLLSIGPCKIQVGCVWVAELLTLFVSFSVIYKGRWRWHLYFTGNNWDDWGKSQVDSHKNTGRDLVFFRSFPTILIHTLHSIVCSFSWKQGHFYFGWIDGFNTQIDSVIHSLCTWVTYSWGEWLGR